jgi:5-formyltetrahydrofolate cyclo-ligase
MAGQEFAKSRWRRQVVARRRSRLGLAPALASDAVPRAPVPDLASASGWEAILPSAGEAVAAYLSMADEPSTAALLRFLAARQLRVLVPAPGPSRRDLAWAEVSPAACALPTRPPGRLPTPPGPRLPPAALRACRLILAPALAVDRSGTRLGRGGGWYDRALAEADRGALILAVCFPWEVLPSKTLPREPHDLSVDGAATANSLIRFDQR